MASGKLKKKSRRKNKKTKKEMQTKIILEEQMDEGDSDEYEAGMFLNKEDIKLICDALREYNPTEKEEHLHGVLLEQFEEILVVDYNEPYPDVN
jgi:hypothetical protein